MEEESQREDVEENEKMAVDPDAWMDNVTTPLHSITEEDDIGEHTTMDESISDETTISHVDETMITESEDVAAQIEAKYGKCTRPHDLRKRKPRIYAHLQQYFGEPMP